MAPKAKTKQPAQTPKAWHLSYRSAGDTLSPDFIVRNTGWKKGREERLSALQFKDLSYYAERFGIPLHPEA